MFCFHKYDKLSRTPHRRVCGYKKCENCPLYLEWKENFEEDRWEVLTKTIKAT